MYPAHIKDPKSSHGFCVLFYKISQLVQYHERYCTVLRAHARYGIKGEYSMVLTSKLYFYIFSLFLSMNILCSVYLHCLTFLDSWTPKIISYGHFCEWLYCEKGQVCIPCTLKHFEVCITIFKAISSWQSSPQLSSHYGLLVLRPSSILWSICECKRRQRCGVSSIICTLFGFRFTYPVIT